MKTKKKLSSKARFALVILASALAGGVTGVMMMLFGGELSSGASALAAGLQKYFLPVWGGVWLALALLSLAFYRRAKRQMLDYAMDEEQEEDKGSGLLSVGVLINSVSMIGSFGAYGASFAAEDGALKMINILGGLVLFVAVIAFSLVYETKAVSLTKRCQPEKKGDPLEFRFQKDWLQSCDEAERLIIYAAAYKTFQLLRIVIVALWAISALGAMYLGFGPLPVLFITIIWLCPTAGYMLFAMKGPRGGGTAPAAGGPACS